MKKKKKEKRKILFLIVTIMAILVSLVIFIDDNRKLMNFEKMFKDGILTIGNFVSKPFILIKDNFFSESSVSYENGISEIENIGINSEMKKENLELKNLLELNSTLSERTYINATVINRNIGYWFNELTINKGTKDGVLENMAVITSKGLIGKIIKVTENSSILKLLTADNMENKISVKIEYGDNFVYGLLSDYEDGYFIIDGISDNIDVSNGVKVLTSGLSDIFPSGILVGYVDDVIVDNFELTKILKVKSDVDFNDIYYVTILKRNVDEIDD